MLVRSTFPQPRVKRGEVASTDPGDEPLAVLPRPGRRVCGNPGWDEPRLLGGPAANLRAGTHPAQYLVAAKAVPVGEALKLLEINLLGQDLQRVVSLLRVTEATQQVDQPLPVIPICTTTPSFFFRARHRRHLLDRV